MYVILNEKTITKKVNIFFESPHEHCIKSITLSEEIVTKETNFLISNTT